MSFFDKISAWFSKESNEIKDSLGEAEQRMDTDLTRRERELAASPEQRMEMIQDEIDSNDQFAEIQDSIDAQQGKALADEELLDQPSIDPESVDPESEEPTSVDSPPEDER